ncbi:G-protein coupled receptor Mth2-like [Chironomus tepperi]|uniref:G-protein coupled receptor Mth2-like n=1 Tax=Chironomus tepperi TaxID=113505 RepID=UPI00391F9E00
MNWRALTIVLATAIPIILVAIILFKDYVDVNDYSCKKNETCVRYCCNSELTCGGKPHEFNGFNFSMNLKQPYRVLSGLDCNHGVYRGTFEEIVFLKNGHIEEDGKQISWKHYCIDIEDQEFVFNICFAPNEMESISRTYPYFMLASLPFLLVTLIVYGFTKELRNLHGKCLMAYVSSLTVMYITLIVNSLTDEYLIQYKIICITLGYTLLTSLLCCFFWLNVMCYDIYRAFRVEIRSESKEQFIIFCAYAFGIPIIYMTIVFVLNFFRFIPDRFNNNIGYGSCSISNSFDKDSHPKIIQWIYIYGPILLLISINIIFYGVTAWKFYCVGRERARIGRTSTSRIHCGHGDTSENRRRFLCYMRLSVIMGLPWIIEILSFSLGSTWLFVASIFNCLQGLVVFITFVYQPRVIKILNKRYNDFKERDRFRSRGNLADRKVQFGGSAATLVDIDIPCNEEPVVEDNNEALDETSFNSSVMNELKEKLSRQS